MASTFPAGYVWGTATAAHQVEGGNWNNDWWAWEHTPGSPCQEPSGDACDHYHRYPEDLDLLAQRGVAPARREEAEAIAELGDDVRLVERADAADEIAEVTRGAAAEAREPLGGDRLRPAAARRQPARRREVMEGDDRHDAARAARGAHAPVVLERGARELAVLGLDPAPLE